MAGPKDLGLYFISDPTVVPDYEGALATEAAIVTDAILIRDIHDLIHRVV